MDWSTDDRSSPAITEGSGDSELWPDAAAQDDGDAEVDDDDAESCCDVRGVGAVLFPPRGYDSSVDDDGSDSDEGGGSSMDYQPAVRWGSRLAKTAAAGREKCPEGEPAAAHLGVVDDVEVADKKPAAGADDRLFWEACLAHGYPS